METAQKYLDEQGGGEVAQNLTGCSLKTLLWEVANGNPVITWVTINLTSRVEERYYWTTPKEKMRYSSSTSTASCSAATT